MSSLEEALTGLKATAKAEPGIAPLAPIFVGAMACWDQTLSKTGGAIIRVTQSGSIVPMRTIMLEPTSTEEGNEGNFDKVVQLHRHFVAILTRENVKLVAHESPPVGGGKLMRPESSLMAATALRIACDTLGITVVMYRAQDVKLRLTGDKKASKAEVKAAIERLIPDVKALKPWNQDVSDAIGVGIHASERNT